MTRKELLEAACMCVCGDRQETYGKVEDNFNRIANFWTIYIGRDDLAFTATDVAAMMALLKLARIASSTQDGAMPKADNWIDLAGYAACGSEAQDSDNTTHATTI